MLKTVYHNDYHNVHHGWQRDLNLGSLMLQQCATAWPLRPA